MGFLDAQFGPDIPGGPKYQGSGIDMNDRALESYQDAIRWFGTDLANDLGHQALGAGGEVGELQNKVKKIERDVGMSQGEFLDVLAQAKEELVDALVYLFGIAGLLNTMDDFDLEAEYDRKRRFNQQRFGAHNRAGG